MVNLPKLVAFDVDQTLTDTKMPVDATMADLVTKLAERTNIAVVSGGSLTQCRAQVVDRLPLSPDVRTHVFLIPTNGAALYRYEKEDGKWHQVYEELLKDEEKGKIFDAFNTVLAEVGFPTAPPKESYGPLMEDRGSQITFSGLGANAPIELKNAWDPDFSKRKYLATQLAPLLPEHTIRIGGTTSLDVTRKGITKAFGLFRLLQYLNLRAEEVLYVGDALFLGGNDASIDLLGVETRSVAAPGLSDTKEVIRELLAL